MAKVQTYCTKELTAAKSFMVQAAGVNVIKLFFRNKLECLSRQALLVHSNTHSSLVRKYVNYRGKKFYSVGPSNWKGLPGTNTPAYLTSSLVMMKKFLA